jgi:hypothetical protein
MYRVVCLLLIFVSVCGCSKSGTDSLSAEAEPARATQVYELSDGVLIRERYDGATYFYLISSEAKNYELVPEGLKVTLDGQTSGITQRPEEGFVFACIETVPGDGLEITRFRVRADELNEAINHLDVSVSVYDVYRMKE